MLIVTIKLKLIFCDVILLYDLILKAPSFSSLSIGQLQPPTQVQLLNDFKLPLRGIGCKVNAAKADL